MDVKIAWVMIPTILETSAHQLLSKTPINGVKGKSSSLPNPVIPWGTYAPIYPLSIPSMYHRSSHEGLKDGKRKDAKNMAINIFYICRSLPSSSHLRYVQQRIVEFSKTLVSKIHRGDPGKGLVVIQQGCHSMEKERAVGKVTNIV